MTWSWQSYFCLTVWFYVLEKNEFVMTLVLFINFVLASVWKLHSLFMYYIYGIEETTSAEKTSIILCDIKEKQLRYKNSFYHVLLLLG